MDLLIKSILFVIFYTIVLYGLIGETSFTLTMSFYNIAIIAIVMTFTIYSNIALDRKLKSK